MKKLLYLVIALSLAANVALAVRWLRRPAATVAGPAVAPAAAAPARRVADAESWNRLKTDDLPKLVERLRAAGFPPAVLRAIISAQVAELFDARRKALNPNADAVPFWKNGAMFDPKRRIAERDLFREQQKLLRDLLGPEADADDPISQVFRNRGLTNMPAEKADRVRAILQEYNDRRTDIYMSGVGVGPIDQNKLRELQQAEKAAIAGVLTPQELERYELEAGSTAQSLRQQLAFFNPTEDEFLKLYRIRKAYDDENTPMGPTSDPALVQQRRQAYEQMKDAIQQALGPERAAEYEKTSDYQYQQTARLIARLDLPTTNVDQLYALQKDYTQRATEIRRAARGESAYEQLTALQAEATAKVAPLVAGDRGLEAYKQYGGTWLRMMAPVRPPSARGAAGGTTP